MVDLGYLGLFLASFLAATVLPFSSEALLSAMLYFKYHAGLCLLVATLGNFLGGMSSYYLGYMGQHVWIEKYLKLELSKIEKVQQKITGKASWISFFCWLPVIGDLIAVALGFLKQNTLKVAVGMFLGKAARYIFIIYGVRYFQ